MGFQFILFNFDLKKLGCAICPSTLPQARSKRGWTAVMGDVFVIPIVFSTKARKALVQMASGRHFVESHN